MSKRAMILTGVLFVTAACGGAETANDSAQAPVDSGLTVNTPLTDNVDTSSTAASGRDSGAATKADTGRTGTTRRP